MGRDMNEAKSDRKKEYKALGSFFGRCPRSAFISNGYARPEEGYLEIALEEFEFASDSQQVLDDAEIVNGVLPGNHDNRSGNSVGA